MSAAVLAGALAQAAAAAPTPGHRPAHATAATTQSARAASAANARDLAATHTYLTASYKVLSTAVNEWPSIESAIRKLDAQMHSECPTAGADAPENAAEQKLTYEAVGALWAVGYHTEAAAVRTYVATIDRLSWSNPRITRDARRLARSLKEMVALQVPPLCADIHTWSASGYGAMPADVLGYDQHVEAINIEEIPRSLLAPYVPASEHTLRSRAEHASTRFAELEFMRGQTDWITLLEEVGLPE